MAKKKPIGRVTTGGGGIGTAAQVGLGPSRPSMPVVTPQTQQPLVSNPYIAPTPPIDPAFEAYKVTAARNIALANADATYQSARLDNQYGFGADQSNPYSQAKMLITNYQRSQRGTENSYANMGQLYSGARQVAQGENTRNYNIGYDQARRQYDDARYGIQRGKAETYANYGTGVDDASFSALLRALGG